MSDKKKSLFAFGEAVDGYEVPMFNEREVRAAAGILFLFAFISFMQAFLVGNFLYLKIFVVIFFTDFVIRLFINPKFAPSLILGRLFVKNQDVEYSGAPQKKFAWGLGLALATFMLVWLHWFDGRGMINLLVCFTCLTFLFFEAAFGICVGCKMYNAFTKNTAKYCPGGACAIKRKEPVQEVSKVQLIILFVAIITASIFGYSYVSAETAEPQPLVQDCEVPDFAKAIGHEEMYKLHHGCE